MSHLTPGSISDLDLWTLHVPSQRRYTQWAYPVSIVQVVWRFDISLKNHGAGTQHLVVQVSMAMKWLNQTRRDGNSRGTNIRQ